MTETTVGTLFKPGIPALRTKPERIKGNSTYDFGIHKDYIREGQIYGEPGCGVSKVEEESFNDKVDRELRRSNDMYGFGMPRSNEVAS